MCDFFCTNVSRTLVLVSTFQLLFIPATSSTLSPWDGGLGES